MIKTDLITFKTMKTTLDVVNTENMVRIKDTMESFKDEVRAMITKLVSLEYFNEKTRSKASQYYVEDKISKMQNFVRSVTYNLCL